MIFGFDTESRIHAKAALILYAIYRSREQNSSLTGLETWKRFNSYVAGAAEESENVREFVDRFADKAGTLAIQRRFMDTGEPIQLKTNELITLKGLYNVPISMFDDKDGELLELLRNEVYSLVMLVQARREREKLKGDFDYDEN